MFHRGSASDISDIALLHHDLQNTGVAQNYMVGLAHAGGTGKLVLLDTETAEVMLYLVPSIASSIEY